jgi:hypothetical protein
MWIRVHSSGTPCYVHVATGGSLVILDVAGITVSLYYIYLLAITFLIKCMIAIG